MSDIVAKFAVNEKKDEDVGVNTTYISHEIWFHTSGIDFPHAILKMLKSLFYKVDES